MSLYSLTPSIIGQVTSHSRYKALLVARGIDDNWRDALLVMVNEVQDITGIHVGLDEDY